MRLHLDRYKYPSERLGLLKAPHRDLHRAVQPATQTFISLRSLLVNSTKQADARLPPFLPLLESLHRVTLQQSSEYFQRHQHRLRSLSAPFCEVDDPSGD